MITSEFFDQIIYKPPRKIKNPYYINQIIGLDTESYTTGEPFLLALSTGEYTIHFDTVFDWLLNKNHHDYGCWNLKYDAGSILYKLNKGLLKELQEYGITDFSGYVISYIPHKYLEIKKDENIVRIWDICQYYKMSLDKAAQTYLHNQKIHIEDKNFTPERVKAEFDEIVKYCIKDASLTSSLGEYLIDKLKLFDIQASRLYSTASISYQYFEKEAGIIHIKRFWKSYKDLVKIAIDSYQGGKFECTSRGYFENAYEYDIVSAYPNSIRNLVDITKAHVVKSKFPPVDAHYSFLRVRIKLYNDINLPFGKLVGALRVYGIGEYYTTITGLEYAYLLEHNIDVEIFECWSLIVPVIRYPYRLVIDTLFTRKEKCKDDKMEYSLCKILMNGFYGKMVQCQYDKLEEMYMTGQGFNPIYASYITAETRLAVTRIQQELKDDCLAVHTDSVITKKPVPALHVTGKLGGFDFEVSGKTIIVGCGCYQIGDKGAYKGFVPKINNGIKDNWEILLSRYKNSAKIPYSALRVESWKECAAKGHWGKINLFQDVPKDINMNSDYKRDWSQKMKAGDYMKAEYRSKPIIFCEDEKPEYWKCV
jgi:hypothetical protein